MLHLPKEVFDIKNEQFSGSMVSQLMNVSTQIGVIKGQARATPLKNILVKIMLIAELRYLNALQGMDCSYMEIMGCLSGKENNVFKQQHLRLLESMEFIRQVTSTYPVLPATDLLRINDLLSYGEDGILQSKDVPIHIETVSPELWELLSPLYNPANEFPKLIEAILIWYCLDKASIGVNLHPFCKELILNYSLNKTFDVNHYSLFITKEIMTKRLDCETAEDYVNRFLGIILDSALAKGTTIIALERAINSMERELKDNLPKLYNKQLLSMLRENLTVSNTIAEKELKVSHKTAISYLKQLEEYGFLTSIKSGREKLYINRRTLEIMDSGM